MKNNIGTLRIVSTPIGNLSDITYRAIDILKDSHIIAAEDTRVSRKLLNHYDIETKMISYFEHNKFSRIKQIMATLSNGMDVAVISDAGTPAISDPGYRLIRLCVDNNIQYTLIPGASSVINALIMSGLPTDKFSFYGFIPRKISEQERFIDFLKYDGKTAIFFESSKRVENTLNNLSKWIEPDRGISICKEMTKIHENVIRGKLSNILESIHKNKINLKGEIVVVIEGSNKNEIKFQIDPKVKKEFLAKLPARDAAKLIASISGQNKREIYKKLIEK